MCLSSLGVACWSQALVSQVGMHVFHDLLSNCAGSRYVVQDNREALLPEACLVLSEQKLTLTMTFCSCVACIYTPFQVSFDFATPMDVSAKFDPEHRG